APLLLDFFKSGEPLAADGCPKSHTLLGSKRISAFHVDKAGRLVSIGNLFRPRAVLDRLFKLAFMATDNLFSLGWVTEGDATLVRRRAVFPLLLLFDFTIQTLPLRWLNSWDRR